MMVIINYWGNEMTLNELKFVVAVAQERSFRRAAEKCFVTQPALSLGIKKLEEELDVIIFERSRSEVTPTEIGAQLIEQANIVLEQSNRLKEMAKLGTNPLEGMFKLGMIHSVGPYLLPEIQVQSLYDEDFSVVVPSNHHWANRKLIKAEELSDEKVLLLSSGHCFSNQVTQACPELSRKGEVLQGNSLETIRNMVASNLGITVLPTSATVARYANPLLKVIPFEKPVPTRRIAIAWRKSYVRTQAIEKLVEAIVKVNQALV